MKHIAPILLIIVTASLCFFFFIRPAFMESKASKQLEVVSENEAMESYMYIGEDERGEASFIKMKDEIKWLSEVVKNFAPLLTLAGAYFLRKRKK